MVIYCCNRTGIIMGEIVWNNEYLLTCSWRHGSDLEHPTDGKFNGFCFRADRKRAPIIWEEKQRERERERNINEKKKKKEKKARKKTTCERIPVRKEQRRNKKRRDLTRRDAAATKKRSRRETSRWCSHAALFPMNLFNRYFNRTIIAFSFIHSLTRLWWPLIGPLEPVFRAVSEHFYWVGN